ncbi:MAG: hypothetical protein EOP07_15815 [Proteobacteria bacterium]|nr:MAG: hypothetical protein EOP07_15815 [Pseudomonadota bacterium]
MSKSKALAVSPLWKIIILLQAALVAWIGLTHGSGIEIYLQKFSMLDEKAILAWDRNIAGLIAVLGLSVLWKPWRPVLILLALLYFGETLLLHLSGGTVDERLPLLANAVHYALPLAVFAVASRRWGAVAIQIALVLTLGNFIMIFLNAAPYYLNAVFALTRSFGFAPTEVAAQAILLGLSVILTAALFWSSKATWAFVLIGLFSLGLMLLHWSNFGPGLAPEALLKLELLAIAAALWSIRSKTTESRLFF